ncbi:hypothetical protein [Bradyrhizobium lablabi]|uniref:hypothetical protein n=1 Tax=Bradyrhizobium lablabi TaxID=722472 RepID=UPI001BAA4647|nr:hypothetical protein [Bradyrhizobium lablabi]MBR0693690.1 hypothetical protein [Bradyrhizobium lablabi]
MLLLLFGQQSDPTPPPVVVTEAATAPSTSDDIVARVKKLIPHRWFRWVAPYRDAIIGGLADSAAWNFTLIAYAKAQTRLATAYGIWLDIFCYDFLGGALTRSGLQDDSFRAVIRATILQERVTRAGMSNAVTRITGLVPLIFEPWNTGDTGGYAHQASGVISGGQFGYGVGNGGYGNMNLPAQVLMQVHRSAPSGVPGVDGYDGTIAGYGAGAIEYVGSTTQLEGITDALIYNQINMTKPTGSIAWISFTSPALVLTDDAGNPLTDGSNLLVTK